MTAPALPVLPGPELQSRDGRIVSHLVENIWERDNVVAQRVLPQHATVELLEHGPYPPNYNQLLIALGESREMLDWEDDWDGEGSPAYKEETWARARAFLVDNFIRFWRKHGRTVEVPRIRPGPDGSIDIQWQDHGRQLLLNMPADDSEPATYYGRSATGPVEGSFNPTENALWLMTWLAV